MTQALYLRRIARRLWPASLAVLLLATPGRAEAIFSASGPDAASIQSAVDAFRIALGTLNPNVAGSFGSGRRQIDWDGVPDAFAAPNNLPLNFFNANSPRGAVFSTPGTAVQVSANAGVAPVEFGNINPSYTGLFRTFSPQRLFTPIGSNVVDVTFFVAGSAQAALIRGFGSVFSDVDLANTTSIQFFDVNNVSLGTFFAPIASGNETLSFLGVDFGANVVRRVRITNGNVALAAGVNETGNNDLVVMDDFIYGEPVAVPEPASVILTGLGLVGGLIMLRRRGRGAS